MQVATDVEESESDPALSLDDADLDVDQPAAVLLPSQTAVLPEEQWSGFKLVGDNIDKNVHHTYQRLGQETMSLHYFHRFAVLDRVDFRQLSNVRPCTVNLDIDDLQLMPSVEDIKNLEEEFAVLVSRWAIVWCIQA